RTGERSWLYARSTAVYLQVGAWLSPQSWGSHPDGVIFEDWQARAVSRRGLLASRARALCPMPACTQSGRVQIRANRQWCTCTSHLHVHSLVSRPCLHVRRFASAYADYTDGRKLEFVHARARVHNPLDRFFEICPKTKKSGYAPARA